MAFNALVGGGKAKKSIIPAPPSSIVERSKSIGDTSSYFSDSAMKGNNNILSFENFSDELDNNRSMIKAEYVGEAVCNILPVALPSSVVPRSVALVNECLLAVEVSSFQVLASSNVNFSLNRSHISDTLLHHFVCVIRSTNKPCTVTSREIPEQGTVYEQPKISLDNPNDNDVMYDDLYSTDYAENLGDMLASTKNVGKLSTTVDGANERMISRNHLLNQHRRDHEQTGSREDEDASSYPRIVLLTQHVNGRTPEVRLVVGMDRLMRLENVVDGGPNMTVDNFNENRVKMEFDSGDVVIINFFTSLAQSGRGSGLISTEQESAIASKERFLWALLQLHAILCSSQARSQSNRNDRITMLSPLIERKIDGPNIDRNELQYYSNVNEFLKSIPSLSHILHKRDTFQAKDGPDSKITDTAVHDIEGLAYDLMMGGYMSRVQLFSNHYERQYATEILNSLLSRLVPNLEEQKINEEEQTVLEQLDEANYSHISDLLHKETRNLEAEMCRRLIAWEDEKYSSLTLSGLDGLSSSSSIPGTESASLISLLQVLDKLDIELKGMELWLEDKAKSLKPTFDDCKDIEIGNNRLLTQSQSYDLLQTEIRKHLEALDFPRQIENVLKNPSSQLTRSIRGAIDLVQSKENIDSLFNAGQALKETIDKIQKDGGMHLRAVNDRARLLMSLSNIFCHELIQILEEFINGQSQELLMDSKNQMEINTSHSFVGKIIKDTQKKFQSSVLNYMKLIEVVALLRASDLPKIRKKYEKAVFSGILSMERMLIYHSSLPSTNLTTIFNYGLHQFTSIGSSTGFVIEAASVNMSPVPAQDIMIVLNELLPLFVREAFFTASIFGVSSKDKNFEAVKKSVDYSTANMKAVISSVCGLPSSDGEVKREGSPHLCLVASLYLQEVFGGYQSKEKKSGDQSLSLAYVRSVITSIIKKTDYVWVRWVEEQIKWIRTHPGVPLDGKKAGIFSSFSRFPSYLDYVITCCKSGKADGSVPNLSKSKAISYYLQKMAGALFSSLQDCASRETTEKDYAVHVMQIENSHFFYHSLKSRDAVFSDILKNQITSAHALCKKSIDSYLGWMIKQDLKALHSLFSNITRVRKQVGDADVQMHIPRQTFEKIFSEQASYDILKGKIATMHSLMQKHFSVASGLVPMLWKAFGKILFEWFTRWEKIGTQCYKLVLQPSAVDVVKMTKLIAGNEGIRKVGIMQVTV